MDAEPESIIQNANQESDSEDEKEDEDEEEEDGIIINVEDLDETAGRKNGRSEGDEGMPLEGKLESEIECQQCHFKPKPTVSTFVVLTLPVPQKVCSSGLCQWDTWF